MTIFFTCLVFWDAMQAIGWVMNIPWIKKRAVEEGTYCLSQCASSQRFLASADHISTSTAVVQHLSDVGGSLYITAISIWLATDHIFLSRRMSVRTACIIVGIMSLVQLLNVVVAVRIFHGARFFYGPAG